MFSNEPDAAYRFEHSTDLVQDLEASFLLSARQSHEPLIEHVTCDGEYI